MGAKRDFQRFGKQLGRGLKSDAQAVARGTLLAAPKVLGVLGGGLGAAAGAASTMGGGTVVGGALGASIGTELGKDVAKRSGKIRFLQK
jgi:hypothetical protein